MLCWNFPYQKQKLYGLWRSNIFPLIRNSLTSWLRLLYLYWPKMVEVMMVFPSLLPSSILFCKGMDLGVLESCIRDFLLYRIQDFLCTGIALSWNWTLRLVEIRLVLEMCENYLKLHLQLMIKMSDCGKTIIIWKSSWEHQKLQQPFTGEHGKPWRRVFPFYPHWICDQSHVWILSKFWLGNEYFEQVI